MTVTFKMRFIVLSYIFAGFVSQKVNCASLNDTTSLFTNLLTNYNKNVRPVYDQTSAVNVGIILFIKSIQEFDEVNGRIALTAALQLKWFDHNLQWNPSSYGGLDIITMPYNEVWVPEMTLSDPANKYTTIGKTTDVIRYKNNGESEWMPANLIESACGVDVKYYPFDTQQCAISFVSAGYIKDEVYLYDRLPSVSLEVYSENSLWSVEGSAVSKSIVSATNESQITFTLNLRRKSQFITINIVVPILVLSLLNVFVFILVPESGERIGYCITTLLAIAVYNTIVSDMLPQTSEPVPQISYKLLVDFIISALIVLTTILNTRVQNREDNDNIPLFLRRMYIFLRCKGCKKTNKPEVNQSPQIKKEEAVKDNTKMFTDHNGEAIENEIHEKQPITWKQISTMLDWMCFIFFTTASVLSFVIYISGTVQ